MDQAMGSPSYSKANYAASFLLGSHLLRQFEAFKVWQRFRVTARNVPVEQCL